MYHHSLFGQKKPSHASYRENSLYYFLLDHANDPVLSGYRIDKSLNDARHVIYIRLTPSIELPTVFPGFRCVEQHLSIDQRVKKDTVLFSPSHLTMIYENSQTRYIIHAYFNRHAALIHIEIKCIHLEDGSIKTIDAPTIENTRFLIYQHAHQSQQLLKQLIDRKAQVYSALITQYHSKERQLSDLLQDLTDALNTNQALIMIDELQTILTTINHYHDLHEMTGSAQLTELSDRLTHLHKKPDAVISTQTMLEATRLDDDSMSMLLPSTTTAPTITQVSVKQELTNRLKKQVDVINELWENTPDKQQALIQCDQLLKEFKEGILDLELNHPSKQVKNLIKKLLKKLTIHEAILDYFEEIIANGNLDAVLFTYNYVVNHYNLIPVFFKFLQDIESCTDASLTDSLIKIAEFFYEHSEQYRSAVICSNARFTYIPEKKSACGRLLRLFLKDNIKVFNLFLQQGTLPEEAQLMCHQIGFNALQSIIVCFYYNPNPKFIHALLSIGAQMEITSSLGSILPLAMQQTTPSNKASNTLNLTYEEMVRSSRINKMFDLAMDTPSNCLLIETLLPYTCPTTIMVHVGSLLTGRAFGFLLVSGSSSIKPLLLPDRNTAIQIIQESNKKNSGEIRFYFCRVNFDEKYNELYTTCQILLSYIVDHFPRLDIDKQRNFIEHWKSKAKEHLQNKQVEKTQTAIVTAQLANTLIPKRTYHDDEMMLRLFCLSAEWTTTTTKPEFKAPMYKQALDFANALPDARKEPLIQSALYKYIHSKVDVSDRLEENAQANYKR